MTHLSTLPFVIALAQPGQGPQSVWMTLIPFGLMLGIFWVLVLLPMRKRQKKVQEFQASLKVGDRVIMTSGIYGLIVRLDTTTVKVEIADKVRVEVARASIGGLQGQEPVVKPESGGI
jgi:preprotein translocase subunit YajC